MRTIGTLVVVTVILLLAVACGDGGGVTPPENEAPVADFAVPTCTIDVDCPFVSTSSDDAAVTGWSWDFNGDNQEDATSATASYTYTAAGEFNVSLTVHDAQGLTHTKTSPITIAPAEPTPPPPVNEPPTAGFVPSCAQTVCTFVSTSTDVAPGTIASYAWTFGDGGTATVNNPSHTYSVTAATEFTVTLTVTDNEGATAVATQSIAVNPAPPANPAPTARFSFSCAGVVCTFVNTSFDHGGRIMAQAWTFGDGGTATEATATHTYTVTTVTEFTVTLTVTDNGGATGVTSKTFTLDPNATNVPPTASFVPWCYGDGCLFTSTSTDAAPGKVLNYAWDFGDGVTSQWDNWLFREHVETHVYTVSGPTTFTVTLTVTDNEGATAVATRTVTLSPLPPAVQGCTTSGKTVECVLDIPVRSTLKTTLLGVNCELVEKLSTPPPVGDQLFITVCNNKPGDAIGIFGGTLDGLWVYETGTQARIWFTQGNPKPGQTLNPAAGQLTGNFPDWTLSFEDGDHPGAPGEPDFTDVVVGVHATTR
jgi:PKD repeat protein